MRSFNQFPYIVVVSLVSVVTSACGSTASTPPGPSGSAGFVDNGAGGAVQNGSGGAVQNSSGGGVQNGSGGAVQSSSGGAQTGGGGAQTGGGGAQTGGGGAQTGAGGGGVVDPQCVTNVTSQTTAAQKTLPAGCAECICGSCGSDVSAINSDDKAKGLLTCSLKKGCSGDCCLCGAVCDATGGSNFGNGPCAAEVMTAAGQTGTASPLTAAFVGAPVKAACTMPATPTSCSKPQDLSTCIAMNCATQCPGVVTACM